MSLLVLRSSHQEDSGVAGSSKAYRLPRSASAPVIPASLHKKRKDKHIKDNNVEKAKQLTIAVAVDQDDWSAHLQDLFGTSDDVASASQPPSAPITKPVELISCSICFEDSPVALTFAHPVCRHSFCSECVTSHLTIGIKNGNSNKLFCLQSGCKSTFPAHTIQTFVDEKTYAIYQMFINTPGNARWCPRPGCDSPIIRTEAANTTKEICLKDGCNTAMCFDCRSHWHEGETCEAHIARMKNDDILKMKDAEAIQDCPACGIWCEKTDGCEYVMCFSCHHEFCWDCLEPHNHNMSTHKHGPRYKPHVGSYPANYAVLNRRRGGRAKRVVKGIAFGGAVVLAAGPAIAIGIVAAVVVGIPYLSFLAGRKIARSHTNKKRIRRDTMIQREKMGGWARQEKARLEALHLPTTDYLEDLIRESEKKD